MTATAAATGEEQHHVDPYELGVRDGIEHYVRRVVGTPVGRWLVVLAMLMNTVGGPDWRTFEYPPATVGMAFVMAFMVLFIVDFARAEYHRSQEGDDA